MKSSNDFISAGISIHMLPEYIFPSGTAMGLLNCRSSFTASPFLLATNPIVLFPNDFLLTSGAFKAMNTWSFASLVRSEKAVFEAIVPSSSFVLAFSFSSISFAKASRLSCSLRLREVKGRQSYFLSDPSIVMLPASSSTSIQYLFQMVSPTLGLVLRFFNSFNAGRRRWSMLPILL